MHARGIVTRMGRDAPQSKNEDAARRAKRVEPGPAERDAL